MNSDKLERAMKYQATTTNMFNHFAGCLSAALTVKPSYLAGVIPHNSPYT